MSGALRSLAQAALALAITAAGGAAQDAADPAGGAGEPQLPRVLLIGDLSFQNHHGNAAKALQGQAEVTRSALGHLDTGAALRRIDELLGDGDWDLIVFNFGLSDLMCRDPRTKQIRAMSPAAGGRPVSPAADYARNLESLVERFRRSGATLVWTSTLPLHPRSRNSALDPAAIATYNALAARVMQDHDVAVLDTHAQIEAKLAEAANPRNRDRLHNDLFKGDLSAPLVTRIRQLVDA